MLKEIGSVFSFLTIIPTGNANLEIVAKYMYLFPIVGIAIGLLVGSIGFGLSFFLDPLIVSLLVVASLALITGIHHTDGLADFADGLMVKGSKDKKLKAMKDLSTGSAGIVTIGTAVPGAVEELDAVAEPLVGEVLVVGVDTEYPLINLQIFVLEIDDAKLKDFVHTMGNLDLSSARLLALLHYESA